MLHRQLLDNVAQLELELSSNSSSSFRAHTNTNSYWEYLLLYLISIQYISSPQLLEDMLHRHLLHNVVQLELELHSLDLKKRKKREWLPVLQVYFLPSL